MRVTGVSFSSDKKLARCEMQYSYRYDQGLKARLKKTGLYRGDWIHQLLEEYRHKRDWEKKFKELKRTSWMPLFDEEKEMYGEKFPDQIYDLFGHYVEHWKDNDKNWRVIQVEQDFEMMTKLGFPVRWKSDYIVRDGKSIVLVENKNLKRLPTSEERILSPQVHSYCWLLSKLPQPILVNRILWDYIRTEPVTVPQLKKNGDISKRKIETDQRTYLRFMKENKIHPKGEEAIGVQQFIDNLPETLSLQRIYNAPNLKVGEQFVRDWVERARRAQGTQRPLRNFNRNCKWDCDYLLLCQADMIGKPDRNTIIKKDFVTHIKRANAHDEVVTSTVKSLKLWYGE